MVFNFRKIKFSVLFSLLIWTVQQQNVWAQKNNSPLEYSGFFDSYYHRGPFNYTLSGGLAGYSGDLCGGIGCQKLGYNFGLGFSYKTWPRVYFGGEFNYFTLGATDEVKTRNISFTSTNFEIIAFGKFYFIDDIVRVAVDRKKKHKNLKPYFTMGLGGLVFIPKSTYDSIPADGVLKSEGLTYPGITAVFPAGFGLQYVITPRVSILGELTYRLTISDYLDDVGLIRGNNKGLKDSYAFVNIKLQITPAAPAKKKKRVLPVPESTGVVGGASSNGASDAATPPSEKPAEQAAEGGAPTENVAPAETSPTENNLQNLQPQGDNPDKNMAK
jgi:hypothetical protein